ncbi:PREDICTED: uncharacterized protein LOC108560162 [Nicrophorus vespilloides]|uniref:Uncharacterized protein LOC108560162 n=1 Tax=Nicrophorus vespilloides TaxID=110193 RepID=A0ABM1MEU7_NICVS|nr:PREDICTED: uncharacterized protein LOC108560162 [Nicrophorus vespilloides]
MIWVSLSSVILLSVLSIIDTFSIIFSDSCDSLGTLLYDEIGCKPIKEVNISCPVAYNCSNYQLPKNGCLFKTHVYKSGETINKTNPCNYCTCYKNSQNKFQLSCIDWNILRVPYGKYGFSSDCYFTGDLNSCFPSTKCAPYNNAAICVVDHESHIEGQEFQPYGRCMDCVCQKGFEGKLVEPFCRKKRCDVEIKFTKQIINNCAPLYSKFENPICCPRNFICPSDSKIENLVKSKSVDKVEKCKFGSKTFNKMDTLDLVYGDNYTAKCECSLPPLLTCLN